GTAPAAAGSEEADVVLHLLLLECLVIDPDRDDPACSLRGNLDCQPDVVGGPEVLEEERAYLPFSRVPTGLLQKIARLGGNDLGAQLVKPVEVRLASFRQLLR